MPFAKMISKMFKAYETGALRGETLDSYFHALKIFSLQLVLCRRPRHLVKVDCVKVILD